MTGDLVAIHEALSAMHAWRGWVWWPDAAPFEVVAGAILVQNTAWTSAARALERLRLARALTPDAIATMPTEELEDLIRSSGQYRQKARKLRAFLHLAAAHGGLAGLLALPAHELRAALLATWGIGPETADCIVLYASRQPSFVIDAYTKRIFSRLALGPGADASYAAWQAFFEAALPRDTALWATYHALIDLHAKHLCLKAAPRCGECELAPRCTVPNPPAHESR